MAEDEGNPRDDDAPDSSPRQRPEPPPPVLEEPVEPDPAKEAQRLSKQVPIGILFLGALLVILIFLGIVAAVAFFALGPKS